MTTNLPFLRWLVSHPVVREGRTTTAFLVEHPPLSLAPPGRRPPVARIMAAISRRRPGGLPDVESASHERGAGAGESTLTAQMPGTVIRVLVAEGTRSPPASRCSCSRR